MIILALRHHTLSQLRQLQDVEGFGKILMGLRNVDFIFQKKKQKKYQINNFFKF